MSERRKTNTETAIFPGEADNDWKRATSQKGIISKLLEPGCWVQFPKALLLIMTPHEAIFFSFLIGHQDMVHRSVRKKNKKLEMGWFYCTVEQVAREIPIKRKTQTSLLQSLSMKGYLAFTRFGVPPLRYIKINYAKLEKDIQERYGEYDQDSYTR